MRLKVILNKLKILLFPLSLIYYVVTSIRNFLFDFRILTSHTFDIPVISVGNITVGGTGKTPHTEMLIRKLKDKYDLAVLSRGYKRKSKGFVLAGATSDAELIGDEPYQIASKFKDIQVCVCEDRVAGIMKLLTAKPQTKLVLLDDAYQHRYVKPGLSILLVDYNRPVYKDFLLPAGTLRESVSGMKRADIIIVSKAPEVIEDTIRNYWLSKLKLNSRQKLFFTNLKYSDFKPVFDIQSNSLTLDTLQKDFYELLVVTGIAQPDPLINFLKKANLKHELMAFPDHHQYASVDLLKIIKRFESKQAQNKIILTTEKDAVRFRNAYLHVEKIKDKMYYLPIEVCFSEGMDTIFEEYLLNFLMKYHK